MNNGIDENIRTLMAATGLSEGEATEKLSLRVRVSRADSPACANLARDVELLLSRTVSIVDLNMECDVEIALATKYVTTAPLQIWTSLDGDTLSLSAQNDHGEGGDVVPGRIENIHGLLRKIAACYLCGFTLSNALGLLADRNSPSSAPVDSPMLTVRFSDLGIQPELLNSEVMLRDTVLVGAGGVANGFLWATEELRIVGELTIIDPKKVHRGNLNRCLYFGPNDVGMSKSSLLAQRFRRTGLAVTAYDGDLASYLSTRPGKKVTRVITTVDSRRARRSVQNHLPLEVIDASTTDISEIIVHSHRQPTKNACLACIYPHVVNEQQQDEHTAENLGITVDDVRKPLIDEALATKLCANFPALDKAALINTALDTLYKSMCGGGQLRTPAGKQAAAPFAFISNLAGALLALELVRFDTKSHPADDTNYLFLSPWHAPHRHLRAKKPRLADCAFCSQLGTAKAWQTVWPDVFSQTIEPS